MAIKGNIDSTTGPLLAVEQTRNSEQPEIAQARMPATTDDQVIVHRNAEGGGSLYDVLGRYCIIPPGS